MNATKDEKLISKKMYFFTLYRFLSYLNFPINIRSIVSYRIMY